MAADKGTALVTGGSRGLGAAIAKRLAQDGYAVAVNYRSDAASAEAVVDAIKKAGGQAVAIQANVSSEAAVVALFEALDASGLPPLTALVNNAGSIGNLKVTADSMDQLETTSAAQFDSLMATNVLGPLICCREAARRMPRGSAIVNIGSISVRAGTPLVYGMTKCALLGMQRGLVGQLGPKGIRINTVSPGLVETDMTEYLFTSPEARAAVYAKYPLGRVGAPGDVSGAVSHLLSKDAAWTSGADILVSGGVYPQ